MNRKISNDLEIKFDRYILIKLFIEIMIEKTNLQKRCLESDEIVNVFVLIMIKTLVNYILMDNFILLIKCFFYNL